MIAVDWAEPSGKTGRPRGRQAGGHSPSIRTLIDRLGGLSAAARDLGHRHRTTVQGWYERGVIPARRQAEVLALAQRKGIPITAADLIPETSQAEAA